MCWFCETEDARAQLRCFKETTGEMQQTRQCNKPDKRTKPTVPSMSGFRADSEAFFHQGPRPILLTAPRPVRAKVVSVFTVQGKTTPFSRKHHPPEQKNGVRIKSQHLYLPQKCDEHEKNDKCTPSLKSLQYFESSNHPQNM